MNARLLAVVTVIALAVSACGGGEPEPAGSESASPSGTESPTDDPSVSETESPSEALPGERFDGGPAVGAALAVVGVAYDDVLNVRAVPGHDAEIVAELTPTSRGIIATGHNRLLPDSGWFEVEVGDGGWVHGLYAAELGATDDITSQINSGASVTRETMLDLGTAVAEERGLADGSSAITVTVAPTVGDLGEITMDVIGIGDDAVHGERLVVFGTPDEGGESFTLKTVERTLICRRGVDSDRLCV